MRPFSAVLGNRDRQPDVRDRLGAGRARRDQFAFTMIEIALCLAIIGFGLIAIIGVLPTGLNVQKDNRQETIIDQDASVWMDAIRNGAQGYDDLTNYVTSITISWTNNGNNLSGQDIYTRTNSSVTSSPSVPATFRLDSGARIIGILSTPKYIPPAGPLNGGSFRSNYVVAYVRAISGAAVEKPPQNSPAILQDAFSYRMIVEIVPYVPFNPYALDFNFTPTNEALARLRVVNAMQANSHDLRLTFRWPLLPTGEPGNGRYTFRDFAGGRMIVTNDFVLTNRHLSLYFLQPSTYVQTP